MPKSAPLPRMPKSAPLPRIPKSAPLPRIPKSSSISRIPKSSSISRRPKTSSSLRIPKSAPLPIRPKTSSSLRIPKSSSISRRPKSAPLPIRPKTSLSPKKSRNLPPLNISNIPEEIHLKFLNNLFKNPPYYFKFTFNNDLINYLQEKLSIVFTDKSLNKSLSTHIPSILERFLKYITCLDLKNLIIKKNLIHIINKINCEKIDTIKLCNISFDTHDTFKLFLDSFLLKTINVKNVYFDNVNLDYSIILEKYQQFNLLNNITIMNNKLSKQILFDFINLLSINKSVKNVTFINNDVHKSFYENIFTIERSNIFNDKKLYVARNINNSWLLFIWNNDGWFHTVKIDIFGNTTNTGIINNYNHS